MLPSLEIVSGVEHTWEEAVSLWGFIPGADAAGGGSGLCSGSWAGLGGHGPRLRGRLTDCLLFFPDSWSF